MLIAGIFFQVVKSFALQMLRVLRNFGRVVFQDEMFYSKFCKGAKLFKLFVVLEINLKCFPSSKFEPRSFAKCLQNLLIKKNQWKDFGDFLKVGFR